MASTATTYISAINTAFPVAGVDNDTQGFRDNYANIKNGLTALSNEVGAVQSGGVFTTQVNDFQNTGVLQNAHVQSVSYVTKAPTALGSSGNQVIDYTDGNYQIWKITSATNFSFANFPSVTTYSPVQLELYLDPSTSTHYTVTFVGTTATDILLDYNPNNQSTNPVTLTTSSSVLYEVARTTNIATGSGDAYRIRFLGGPYKP